MTTSHVRMPSAISPQTEQSAGWVGRRRRTGARESTWRRTREAEDLHSEEAGMRLVAALLVLATLLVWTLFLRG